MKKGLFFIMSMWLCIALQINAQTLIFEETFDSITEPDLPAGWTAEDRDTNGITWKGNSSYSSDTDSYGFSGKTAFSFSYYTNPDNLLVSPSISLPSGNPATLTFLVGGFKSDFLISNPLEHYAVYILPSGSAFQGTEQPLLEETLPNAGEAFSKSIDLSALAGQDIQIFFRHFNSDSQLALILDNVKVTQENLSVSETGLVSGLTTYPNPVTDYVYLKSKSKITKTEAFDFMGRKMDVKLSDNKIDVRGWKPGIYLINITAEDKIYSQKIIKK